MVVTKILETTLAAGVTSVQFTDSDIPNSLIRVFCSDADLIYTSLSLTGNTLTVTYPAQNVNKSIALELVKAGLDIVDNLSTDDATKALSAKQGKALDDKINALDLEDLYNVSVTEAENGDILIYYAGEWINVPAKNNITDMDDVAVSTIQDGQILAWDEDTEKFVNVNQSGGGSTETYSFTEQEVGTWFGETLYKISYKFANSVTSNDNTWANTGLQINNIKSIIRGEFNRNGIQSFACSFNFSSNNVTIQTYYGSSVTSNTDSVITVWYTKTT